MAFGTAALLTVIFASIYLNEDINVVDPVNKTVSNEHLLENIEPEEML